MKLSFGFGEVFEPITKRMNAKPKQMRITFDTSRDRCGLGLVPDWLKRKRLRFYWLFIGYISANTF